jgi:hypothetical protein
MAMLRAKQIKLVSEGDIIVGGVSGNGVVLSKGTEGQVLKSTASGVTYSTLASTEVSHGAGTVGSKLDAIDTSLAGLQTEVDAIETSVGLNADGTLTAPVGSNYLDAITSVVGGLSALDTAIKAEETRALAAEAALDGRIDALEGFDALRFSGTLAGDILAEDLPATPVIGDVYRIITVGAADFAGLGFDVNVGDFVAYAATGTWVKFDNSDPSVEGVALRTSVTGNAYEGYTIDIDAGYVGQASITTVGTITTGTWNGTTIGQAYGGTGITTVTLAADENKVLTVGADGTLAYAYVSAIRDGAGAVVAEVSGAELVAATATTAGSAALAYTTKGYVDAEISDAIAEVTAGASSKKDEDFVVGAAPDADYEVTLAAAPKASNDVSVYFNGVKLLKTGYTVTGTTVALIDSINGYAAEEGDVISVVYMV